MDNIHNIPFSNSFPSSSSFKCYFPIPPSSPSPFLPTKACASPLITLYHISLG